MPWMEWCSENRFCSLHWGPVIIFTVVCSSSSTKRSKIVTFSNFMTCWVIWWGASCFVNWRSALLVSLNEQHSNQHIKTNRSIWKDFFLGGGRNFFFYRLRAIPEIDKNKALSILSRSIAMVTAMYPVDSDVYRLNSQDLWWINFRCILNFQS